MAVISYLNSFPASNGVEILEAHGQHELLRIDGQADVDQAFATISRSHAWQCIGARDEVPQHFLVSDEFLRRAPNLLIVSASGSGVDVFDLPACTEAGVIAVNQAGANAESVAEHAICMMIGLLKNISSADRALRAGWHGARLDFMGRDLFGRTVGIIGMGHIGQRVAQICRDGFRCNVLAYDPYLDDQQISERQARKVSLNELLSQSEIITVHTPLNAETRGMLDASAFERMPSGAVFISAARGSIHDEAALACALESGHLHGAGLDVWDKEPPPATHRLLALDNVIGTPHVAGATRDSLKNMASYAANQLIEILAGKEPARPVNPDALPRFRERFQAILGSP